MGKFIRISPKKARLVADIVRGRNAKQSLNLLKFNQKKAAHIIYKTVRTAVADAENNHNLDGDKLIIKNILVDGGSSLKRYRPRARGMASHILKRTSHITIIVTDETNDKTSVKSVSAPSRKKERLKIKGKIEAKPEKKSVEKKETKAKEEKIGEKK